MSVPVRIAAFGLVLALAFSAAALAGSRVDVRPGETATAEPAHGEETTGAAHGGETTDEHGGEAVQAVRGLAVSEGGRTLELARTTAPRGREFALRFRIAGDDGATLRDFDLEHARRMHVIVVRRDLTGFQHVHPVQQADGSWRVPLTLRTAGTYRVFADFAADGIRSTLAADLTVDGPATAVPLPSPAGTARTGDLDVALASDAAPTAGEEAELDFAVSRAGEPVTPQDYLGAKGHLVALREGDLAFLHVHPNADRLRFAAAFPTPGRYRLFLQVRDQGRVHTTAFTREVTR